MTSWLGPNRVIVGFAHGLHVYDSSGNFIRAVDGRFVAPLPADGRGHERIVTIIGGDFVDLVDVSDGRATRIAFEWPDGDRSLAGRSGGRAACRHDHDGRRDVAHALGARIGKRSLASDRVAAHPRQPLDPVRDLTRRSIADRPLGGGPGHEGRVPLLARGARAEGDDGRSSDRRHRPGDHRRRGRCRHGQRRDQQLRPRCNTRDAHHRALVRPEVGGASDVGRRGAAGPCQHAQRQPRHRHGCSSFQPATSIRAPGTCSSRLESR